jgi:hypothetical protein
MSLVLGIAGVWSFGSDAPRALGSARIFYLPLSVAARKYLRIRALPAWRNWQTR